MARRVKRSKTDRLIPDIVAFISRYVVATDAQVLVLALWVVHTYLVDLFEQTPYLAVTSPEKQCGKSRLLEVLEQIVPKPWMAITPSEAVVYRKVSATVPTLLLDEVDTIFNPRTADHHEGLRALLNNGHRRGAKVPRCVGSSNNIVEFSTFCPKVLAGLGALPETVADRSIPIRLKRRKRSERVERFLRRTVEPDAEALRERIIEWANAAGERLTDQHPDMPPELSDRMQEGCESLVVIADALGCGDSARVALVELLSGERLDSQETWRMRLLADTKVVWEQQMNGRESAPKGIRSTTLLDGLLKLEESPWAGWYGHGLDFAELASLLKPFGIQPEAIRGKTVFKGYKRHKLEEAWDRYL